MSALRDAWGRTLAEAAMHVAAAVPPEMPDARPVDYAGTGLVAGWLLASRFAAIAPEASRRLTAELDRAEARSAAHIADDERLLAAMVQASGH